MSAVLEQAARVIGDRGKTYGDAGLLFDQIAKRWSVTLGIEVTAAQVGICMIDVKLARLAQNPTHLDSIVDVAGYAALLHKINDHDE